MEDILKSIKATLYERVSNPFLLSFLIAWCVHNYRVIMIAISNEPLNVKLVNIDAHFGSNIVIDGFVVNYGGILHALIIPSIYALIYICVFPYFSKPINQIHFIRQKELLTAKQLAEGLELLTKEQSRELRQKIILLENEFSNKLEKLEQENSELRLIITKSNSISDSESDLAGSKTETAQLTDEELKVLLAFSGYDRRSAVEVAENIEMKLEKVKFICIDLMQKAFLSVHSSNPQGQYLFALEQLGRKYLHDRSLL